ncbi:glycosyltransferase family 25 protein [Yoonia sp.]|uniref:glycosyltransferase family 25 protein n=1 Tax=Yoonia sp. TaxID=2212373 RepID=UPI003F6C5350
MKAVLVQVINLDRSPERLRAIGADLDQMGSVWSRLRAVEPGEDYVSTTRIYNRARANYLFGRDLTRGEVGCFLSHLAALRDLLLSECDVGLILEDDAQLHQNIGQLIDEVSATLSIKVPLWACVNLSYTVDLRRRMVAPVTGNNLYRAYQFPLLSSALLWQKDQAKAFVEWCEGAGLYAPFDNQLRDWIALGNCGISLEYPPVGLRAFPTTIEDRPVATSSCGYTRKINKFTRFELRQKVPLYWRSGISYLTRR